MKKIFVLFVALFCVQFVMAQDYKPASNAKDLYGDWKGTMEEFDSETSKQIMDVQLPPEYSSVQFKTIFFLNLKIENESKENVVVSMAIDVVCEISDKKELPPELIAGFVDDVDAEDDVKIEINKKKTKITVSKSMGAEQERIPCNEFEQYVSQFMISKNKKSILLNTGGMEFELKKQ